MFFYNLLLFSSLVFLVFTIWIMLRLKNLSIKYLESEQRNREKIEILIELIDIKILNSYVTSLEQAVSEENLISIESGCTGCGIGSDYYDSAKIRRKLELLNEITRERQPQPKN